MKTENPIAPHFNSPPNKVRASDPPSKRAQQPVSFSGTSVRSVAFVWNTNGSEAFLCNSSHSGGGPQEVNISNTRDTMKQIVDPVGAAAAAAATVADNMIAEDMGGRESGASNETRVVDGSTGDRETGHHAGGDVDVAGVVGEASTTPRATSLTLKRKIQHVTTITADRPGVDHHKQRDFNKRVKGVTPEYEDAVAVAVAADNVDVLDAQLLAPLTTLVGDDNVEGAPGLADDFDGLIHSMAIGMDAMNPMNMNTRIMGEGLAELDFGFGGEGEAFEDWRGHVGGDKKLDDVDNVNVDDNDDNGSISGEGGYNAPGAVAAAAANGRRRRCHSDMDDWSDDGSQNARRRMTLANLLTAHRAVVGEVSGMDDADDLKADDEEATRRRVGGVHRGGCGGGGADKVEDDDVRRQTAAERKNNKMKKTSKTRGDAAAGAADRVQVQKLAAERLTAKLVKHSKTSLASGEKTTSSSPIRSVFRGRSTVCPTSTLKAHLNGARSAAATPAVSGAQDESTAGAAGGGGVVHRADENKLASGGGGSNKRGRVGRGGDKEKDVAAAATTHPEGEVGSSTREKKRSLDVKGSDRSSSPRRAAAVGGSMKTRSAAAAATTTGAGARARAGAGAGAGTGANNKSAAKKKAVIITPPRTTRRSPVRKR